MTDYPKQGKEIDNNNHPVDKDLSATNDHWGTEIADDGNDQYNKNNMARVMEVRSTLGKIQRNNKARY